MPPVAVEPEASDDIDLSTPSIRMTGDLEKGESLDVSVDDEDLLLVSVLLSLHLRVF